MRYSPFDMTFSDEYKHLENQGIYITESILKADLFICSSLKKRIFPTIFRNFKKPTLLWTNEPRSSSYTKNIDFPIKIEFLNIYSGKVFINNVTYERKRFENRPLLKIFKFENIDLNRKMVALMSYYKGITGNDLKVKGSDVDLINMRNKIAIYGHKNEFIDIYGKGWPEGISRENSRQGNWPETKKIILSQYNFNLAFENTVYPNYVTEKIWDAIENYCLPIYYGGNGSTIYTDFPKKSFLDYAEYGSPEALFNKIQTITLEEYILRLNKCIEVYNGFIQKDKEFWDNITEKRLNNIIEACKNLI